MKTLDFINDVIRNGEDPFPILQAEPYCLKMSIKGNLLMLKYDQVRSDFSNSMVQECRGVIFEKEASGQYSLVCYPMGKFFNYGEINAYQPDVSKLTFMEKVDGSIIKFYWNDGGWKIATNGTIDARTADSRVVGTNFYDLVMEIIGDEVAFRKFTMCMSISFTYMFELIHPKARVVVDYGEKKELVYLGCRNIFTEYEFSANDGNNVFEEFPFVRVPKTFPITLENLDTLQSIADEYNESGVAFEGFVCTEHRNGLVTGRVKIKSPRYLTYHRLTGGSVYNAMMRIVLDNEVEEFKAYLTNLPFYVQDIFNETKEKYDAFVKQAEIYIEKYRAMAVDNDRKTVALDVIDNVPGKYRGFIFGDIYSGRNVRETLQKDTDRGVRDLIGVKTPVKEEDDNA